MQRTSEIVKIAAEMLDVIKLFIFMFGLFQSLNFAWSQEVEKLQVLLSNDQQLKCAFDSTEPVRTWTGEKVEDVSVTTYICDNQNSKAVLIHQAAEHSSSWNIYTLDATNTPASPQVVEVQKNSISLFKTELKAAENPTDLYQTYNQLDRLTSSTLVTLLKSTAKTESKKLLSEIKSQGKQKLTELEQSVAEIQVKTQNGKNLICTRMNSKDLSAGVQAGSCGDLYDKESCHGCPVFSCELSETEKADSKFFLWFGMKNNHGLSHPFHVPVVLQSDADKNFTLDFVEKIQNQQSSPVYSIDVKNLENDRKAYHQLVPTNDEQLEVDSESKLFTLHYLQHGASHFDTYQKECASPDLEQTVRAMGKWFAAEKNKLDSTKAELLLVSQDGALKQKIVPKSLVPRDATKIYGDTWTNNKDLAKTTLWIPSTEKTDITEDQAIKIFSDLVGSADIFWKRPEMFCENRALLAGEIFSAQKISFQKIWVIPERVAGLNPPALEGRISWGYHVAVTANVAKNNGTTERMVFDPALANSPITVDQWLALSGGKKDSESLHPLWPPLAFDLYTAKQQVVISPGNIYKPGEGDSVEEFEKNKTSYVELSKQYMALSRD